MVTNNKLPRMLEIEGKPGVFEWIPIDSLFVDHANYQRPLMPAKVRRIANKWNWRRVETLSVALRESDCLYWIFEGQHRHAAAKLRGDITHLPCMIFEESNSSREASDFLGINKARDKLGAVDEFKTLIAQHIPIALAIEKMMSSTGHFAGKSPHLNSVRAIRRIMDIARSDFDSLEIVWPAVAAVCREGNASISVDVLGTFWYLQRILPKGASLGSPFWVRRACSVGYGQIRAALSIRGGMLKKHFSSGVPYAIELMSILNKGLRSSRLSIDDNRRREVENLAMPGMMATTGITAAGNQVV